jgi:hypothetical protein
MFASIPRREPSRYAHKRKVTQLLRRDLRNMRIESLTRDRVHKGQKTFEHET